MKVVVPMSGMSSRFGTAGYTIPKYLIEVDGKTVIEHIIDLYPKDETDFIFIVNRNHYAYFIFHLIISCLIIFIP